MKVKQIGNIEEKPKDKIPQHVPGAENIIENKIPSQVVDTETPGFDSHLKSKAKGNKNYYFIGGILFIIIAALLYYFLIYQKSEDSVTADKLIQDELKTKELDLKERELKLKEKEQQKNITPPTEQKYSLNTPEGVVVKFIESLGKREFSAAFALMTEKRRGSYNTFVSTKGYGGITGTKVFSCSKTGEINGKYEVTVNYESIDPSNKSGKFNQYFYLIPFNDSYLISEIKNINIQWYD
jgi:hypothetical protein